LPVENTDGENRILTFSALASNDSPGTECHGSRSISGETCGSPPVQCVLSDTEACGRPPVLVLSGTKACACPSIRIEVEGHPPICGRFGGPSSACVLSGAEACWYTSISGEVHGRLSVIGKAHGCPSACVRSDIEARRRPSVSSIEVGSHPPICSQFGTRVCRLPIVSVEVGCYPPICGRFGAHPPACILSSSRSSISSEACSVPSISGEARSRLSITDTEACDCLLIPFDVGGHPPICGRSGAEACRLLVICVQVGGHCIRPAVAGPKLRSAAICLSFASRSVAIRPSVAGSVAVHPLASCPVPRVAAIRLSLAPRLAVSHPPAARSTAVHPLASCLAPDRPSVARSAAIHPSVAGPKPRLTAVCPSASGSHLAPTLVAVHPPPSL
jgi:hypothetical protein